MSDKKRSELRTLIIAFIVILIFTNDALTTKISNFVFARVTWNQIILGIISLRVAYILLTEKLLNKKR